MSERFTVTGPCSVAGVPPGGTVTRAQVEAWGEPGAINVDALIGPHLTPVDAAADSPPDAKTATVKKTPK